MIPSPTNTNTHNTTDTTIPFPTHNNSTTLPLFPLLSCPPILVPLPAPRLPHPLLFLSSPSPRKTKPSSTPSSSFTTNKPMLPQSPPSTPSPPLSLHKSNTITTFSLQSPSPSPPFLLLFLIPITIALLLSLLYLLVTTPPPPPLHSPQSHSSLPTTIVSFLSPPTPLHLLQQSMNPPSPLPTRSYHHNNHHNIAWSRLLSLLIRIARTFLFFSVMDNNNNNISFTKWMVKRVVLSSAITL